MRYCCRCVLPETRPGLLIGPDGVCSACAAHAQRQAVDWVARERAFRDVVDWAKAQRRRYDCVIPVSGGKDSTWQLVTCLDYSLHPLAVTWKPSVRSPLGARNLANLISLGVDHIDVQINPTVERKFLYQALVRYGSTAIPMHLALFNIPLTIAVGLGIPLVVWGENSADEYTGLGDDTRGHRLDGAWLKRHGVTHGTTAADWVSAELTVQELTPYFGPSEEELTRAGVRAIFLGYYVAWDPARSLQVAQRHGFQVRVQGPRVGYYNSSDLDDEFISIHHYLKWYKFGFTRTFDHLSLEIRNGRLSREQAIEIIRERGDETPFEDIETFCTFVGIAQERFFELIEPFRNREIWVKRNGAWMIDGFLVPGWPWEPERMRERTASCG